jgi:hypothetical protein
MIKKHTPDNFQIFNDRETNSIKNIRVKILGNYLIIYEIEPKEIIVLSIWDPR